MVILKKTSLFVLFITSYIPLFILLILRQLKQNEDILHFNGMSRDSILCFFESFWLTIILSLLSIYGLIGVKILFYNLDIEHKSFIVLLSKLRNNDFDYYKKIMGLNIKIDFKGYDNIVKAIVPYKDVPLEFYKWWCKNADKIYMTYKEKIELFNKISMLAPKTLKKEHKQILNN